MKLLTIALATLAFASVANAAPGRLLAKCSSSGVVASKLSYEIRFERKGFSQVGQMASYKVIMLTHGKKPMIIADIDVKNAQAKYDEETGALLSLSSTRGGNVDIVIAGRNSTLIVMQPMIAVSETLISCTSL